MFFLDDSLHRRRVQDIKSISSGRTENRSGVDRWVHDIEMTDGTRIVVLDVTVEQIGRMPALVFAAQPGMVVWTPDPEGGDDFLNPIVGWGITMDGNVIPIAGGGSVNDSDDRATIIAPDGKVWQNGFIQADDLKAYKQLIDEN